MLKIRRDVPVPYYYQLQNIILKKIEQGEWVKGTLLPSEQEICKIYKLSRVTVRKALENLVSEGILEKKRGKGTVVYNDRQHEKLLDHFFSFFEFLKSRNYDVSTKIIEFKIVYPSEDLCNILKIKKGEEIFKSKRLRIVNNEPWYYVDSYFPCRLYPQLSPEDLVNNSFYHFMVTSIGLDIYGFKRKLYTRPAVKMDSELLVVEVGEPLQIFENLNYKKSKLPVEYSINTIRADKTLFEIEITRERLLNIGQNIMTKNSKNKGRKDCYGP